MILDQNNFLQHNRWINFKTSLTVLKQDLSCTNLFILFKLEPPFFARINTLFIVLTTFPWSTFFFSVSFVFYALDKFCFHPNYTFMLPKYVFQISGFFFLTWISINKGRVGLIATCRSLIPLKITFLEIWIKLCTSDFLKPRNVIVFLH